MTPCNAYSKRHESSFCSCIEQVPVLLSPKVVKQVFKLAEYLQESLLIICDQCIAWNKNEKFASF